MAKAGYLFVLEYYPPHVGGVEVLFAQLAETLVAAGHRVTVLTTQLPGTRFREVRNGVHLVRIPSPGFARRYFFTLFALPFAVALATGSRLIHTTTYNAALPAWIASVLTFTPAVLTVHEVFDRQWQELQGLNPLLGWCFRVYERFILSLPFSRMVCDSRFTRERLTRLMNVPEMRSTVIYPAIDYSFWKYGAFRPRGLRAELQLPDATFVYLFFGRPGVSKGVESLIRAAAMVHERRPDSRLVLILAHEPANNYRRIRAMIREAGLEGHVIVLDPVPRADLPGYLLAADCVVIPSLSEGFGYAAAEAATIGCQVIATRGHSVEEVVGPYVTLVPARSAEALAGAVLAVGRHPPPAGPAPPVYTVARHLAETIEVYGRVLRGGTGGEGGCASA